MQYPLLDSRLLSAAELFDICDTGADIGADHGLLSCYLLHHNICKKMLVTDISQDSLKKARQLLKTHHLEDRAEFIVADGLAAINRSVNCIAICGIGGRLMCNILLKGKDRLQGCPVILSCQTDLPAVRKRIYEIGYHITDEKIAYVNRRFYVIMRAEAGEKAVSEKEIFLGPVLLKGKEPVWYDYLKWRYDVIRKGSGNQQQLKWIIEEASDAVSDSSGCI